MKAWLPALIAELVDSPPCSLCLLAWAKPLVSRPPSQVVGSAPPTRRPPKRRAPPPPPVCGHPATPAAPPRGAAAHDQRWGGDPNTRVRQSAFAPESLTMRD